MARGANKMLKEIIRALEEQGFTVRISGGGHYKVYNAEGKPVFTMPSSPGEGRALKNLISDLRRYIGFVWQGR